MEFQKHQLIKDILSCFKNCSKNGYNRYNFLGREYNGGGGVLEHSLRVRFSDEERVFAGQVLKEVEERGLIAPTYEDISSTGDWLKLTEKGKLALESGALDDLDDLLISLKSERDLIAMRYGAHDALNSKSRDWSRHVATSCRELITAVLHTIAPNGELKKDTSFRSSSESKSGITRKQRVKYYINKRDGRVSKGGLNVILKSFNLIDACFERLNAVTHTDKKGAESLLQLTEDALLNLLKP